MKRLLFAAFVISLVTSAQFAQATSSAPDAAALTQLLNEFLAGASRNDAAIHDKFWAEDLIYTGSAGARHGKAELMKGVRSDPAPGPDDPKTIFTAEDIRIQQYGNTAIVAFRLVGTTAGDGVTTVAKFFNTGAFLKRKGKWQAVSWQATRIPVSEEDAKKEVAAAEAEFHKAMLASDTKTLKRLTGDSFIWMHHTGEQVARQKFLDDITSGAVKYAKLETEKVTVTVTGDTAVARGTSARQRVPAKDANGVLKEQTPFVTFYTLTFVNRGGVWKAISYHTSRVV
jgi:ketosteroid isomerase-like protein